MLQEGIERLTQYGYTPEEAQFLTLAALHSGYFVRRQFNEFLGQERGGNAQRFTQKLIALRHARRESYLIALFVYHIRAKGIYGRLGQVDNRNRREKGPFTVKRKLMCLDFVLAHRDRRFLATEAEKVEYFVVEHGVPIEYLPARRYQSRQSTEATDRFFVEKLPIYIDKPAASDEPCDATAAPVVRFAYVDEGTQSTEGFATFLSQHRRLFHALGRFEVVYAATDARWFAKAESTFRRLAGAQAANQPTQFPDALDLIEYFETRRKFETRDFTGLDTNRIVRYRGEKRKFSTDEYEQMYRRWVEGGAQAVFPQANTPAASFRTHLLPHDYDTFGVLRNAS